MKKILHTFSGVLFFPLEFFKERVKEGSKVLPINLEVQRTLSSANTRWSTRDKIATWNKEIMWQTVAKWNRRMNLESHEGISEKEITLNWCDYYALYKANENFYSALGSLTFEAEEVKDSLEVIFPCDEQVLLKECKMRVEVADTLRSRSFLDALFAQNITRVDSSSLRTEIKAVLKEEEFIVNLYPDTNYQRASKVLNDPNFVDAISELMAYGYKLAVFKEAGLISQLVYNQRLLSLQSEINRLSLLDKRLPKTILEQIALDVVVPKRISEGLVGSLASLLKNEPFRSCRLKDSLYEIFISTSVSRFAREQKYGMLPSGDTYDRINYMLDLWFIEAPTVRVGLRTAIHDFALQKRSAEQFHNCSAMERRIIQNRAFLENAISDKPQLFVREPELHSFEEMTTTYFLSVTERLFVVFDWFL